MSLRVVQSMCVAMVFSMVLLSLGIALSLPLYILLKVLQITEFWPLFGRAVVLAFTSGFGFCFFGFNLFLTVGLMNYVFNFRLVEGNFRYSDVPAMKWFFHNALMLLVRTLFMDFMLLTPSSNVFYTMMGAKLGKNVHINSKLVADLSLLEIGDNSIIGGNATVIGHVFEDYCLKLKKIKIGKNVTIGLNSVIMPGCEIGDGAIIAAGAVLVKDTIVPPGDIFVGIPAESIKNKKIV
jgi:hypothetical protein